MSPDPRPLESSRRRPRRSSHSSTDDRPSARNISPSPQRRNRHANHRSPSPIPRLARRSRSPPSDDDYSRRKRRRTHSRSPLRSPIKRGRNDRSRDDDRNARYTTRQSSRDRSVEGNSRNHPRDKRRSRERRRRSPDLSRNNTARSRSRSRSPPRRRPRDRSRSRSQSRDRFRSKRDTSRDRPPRRHRSRDSHRRDRNPSASPPRRSSNKHRSRSRSRSPSSRNLLPPVRRSAPLPPQNTAFAQNEAPPGTDPPPEKQQPNFKATGLLAKEANKVAGTSISLKYHEPPEARKPPPSATWSLLTFKESEHLNTTELYTRSCWLIGREAKVTDITIEHPSCSGQHAVVQFRHREKMGADGSRKGRVKPYVIDLESRNGTVLNGDKIEAGRYVELRSGDVLKFGESVREHVVMLPPKE